MKTGQKNSEAGRSGSRRLLFWSMLFGLTLFLSLQVSAANLYTIQFNNNKGTSTSVAYKRLQIVARKNQIITLPSVSEVEGYTNVGWTTTKGGTSPIFKMGSKVKVTGNATYYLVRKKIAYCTVQFYSNKGGIAFTALTAKVVKGKSLKLPELPEYSLYTSKGWTSKKGGTAVTNQAGSSIKVTSNLKFYSVYKKKATVTVSLYANDGVTLYQTKTVAKGEPYKLPGLLDPSGYTMMGWATKPRQSVATSTAYYVGESLTVSKNIKLYAAMFDHNDEPDLNAAALPTARKYQKVIFVGDSRTYRLGLTMQAQGTDLANVSFVALNSSGLNWLKTDGYQQLMEEIQKTDPEDEKPIAVIFNHGINDLHNQSRYITYMKELAEELQPLNCKLFYLSVNPDNSKILKSRGASDIREEERVRAFNTAIQKELCTDGTYTFLNTYHYLMRTGFHMDNNPYGYDIGLDDGAHYSVKTSKIIYWYCITKLNNLPV